MRPSDIQIRMIVDTVKQYGTLALAAENAGMAPGALTRLLETDEDLASEVNDALAIFKDVLRMQVLQRSMRSDAMLKLAVEGFIPEQFKAAPVDSKAKGKPSGLTLRQFDDEGNDKPVEKPTPAAPLHIGMEQGL